jgi:hypothetical protein
LNNSKNILNTHQKQASQQSDCMKNMKICLDIVCKKSWETCFRWGYFWSYALLMSVRLS